VFGAGAVAVVGSGISLSRMREAEAMTESGSQRGNLPVIQVETVGEPTPWIARP